MPLKAPGGFGFLPMPRQAHFAGGTHELFLRRSDVKFSFEVQRRLCKVLLVLEEPSLFLIVSSDVDSTKNYVTRNHFEYVTN